MSCDIQYEDDSKIRVDATGKHVVSRKDDSAKIHFCKPGQSLPRSSLRSPRANTPVEHAIALATLFLFFGLFYVLPLLSSWAFYSTIFYQNRTAAIILSIFIADSLLPAGSRWEAFSASRVFDTWRRYFRLKVVMPEAPFLDQDRHYLAAQVPHACFPFGGLLTQHLAGDRSIGMPPGPVSGVIASILLQLPFYKHFFAWLGCAPANSKDVVRLLQKSTVGCIPEGVAGIFQGANRSRERLYLRSRKGFIRLAIKAGTDIIPIYHLGNSQMLTYCGSEWLSRKTRMTVGMFWGWNGLPIPFQHDIITCVGMPIKVTKIDNPSEDQISTIQDKLLAALEELYNRHRHLLGWQNRPLEIA